MGSSDGEKYITNADITQLYNLLRYYKYEVKKSKNEITLYLLHIEYGNISIQITCKIKVIGINEYKLECYANDLLIKKMNTTIGSNAENEMIYYIKNINLEIRKYIEEMDKKYLTSERGVINYLISVM